MQTLLMSMATRKCLHAAVIGCCSTGIVQAFIDHRVNVNTTNYDRKSALNLPCRTGNEDAKNVVLKAEASSIITDADG